MKKLTPLLALLFIGASSMQANPVPVNAAQQFAGSYFTNATRIPALTVSVAHTETSTNGTPLYYVFNINATGGFIIIAADDAAHPVIGYSTEGQYQVPDPGTTIGWWMAQRKAEMEYIIANHLQADKAIANEWAVGFVNNAANRSTNSNAPTVQSVSPLVQTTWNQSPYYNAMCPGGSVTGCVATAMSQIMRFWNYPAQGTGSSSYCDCTSQGFTMQYGTLSANYGATTFNWGNMPLALNSNNTDVATLNFECGVSVEMDYSPSESGAWVITADSPVCAQTSYVSYFGYDPNTIQGLLRSNYGDPAWIQLVENDLNIGRPVQYVGSDPSAGGHTWVCDGYDASNNFHMNWGWGGADDGYYGLNNMNPGGYNFSQTHEALIGIQPLANVANDAGIPTVVSPTGMSCSSSFTPVVVLKNFGTNALTSCMINYQVDNNTAQTYNWSGSLASGAYTNVTLPSVSVSAGTHTLTCFTSSPNSTTDGNANNNQSVSTFMSNTAVTSLPVSEGFQSSANLPAGWTLYNPDNDVAWTISTTIGHTSTQCIGFNNCDGDNQTDMTGRKDRFITGNYDFSSAPAPTMTFDVAYSALNYQSTMYTDTLVVYYSTDCGTTWQQLYRKGGVTLQTAPTTTSINSCWSPTAAQWRTENINLNTLIGQPSVMFAFEDISDWGEWIYLDNININSNVTTSIATENSAAGIDVYPNPAGNSFTLTMSGLSGNAQYIIFDMSGKAVKAGTINAASGSYKEEISVADLSNGMYFVKVSDAENTSVIKLTVSH